MAPADSQSVPSSAADYYRRPERKTSGYRQRNVDQTKRLSRQLPAETSPAQWFDDVTHDAVNKLSHDDLNRIVLISQHRAMRLADWVLNPGHLDRRPRPRRRPHGRRTAGRTPLDDHTLLATATGRRALTAEDEQHLGPLRERIPVLS